MIARLDHQMLWILTGLLALLLASSITGFVLSRMAQSEGGKATVNNLNARIGEWWKMCGIKVLWSARLVRIRLMYSRKARTVAKQKLGTRHESQLKLYWNKTIEWGPKVRLERLESEKEDNHENAESAPPQIVILDLFFDGQTFRGEDFLRSLREWEVSLSLEAAASWVILWSVRTGLKDVDHFLQEEPRRDRRVVSLQTKGDIALLEAVSGCWQSLEEERYP